VLRVGHRGAPALAPENTIASLAAAIEHGVDLVEIDVVARAGTLSVAHSATQLTAESPTLGDVLSFLAHEDVGLIVDLKRRGLETEVVAALRRHDFLDRSVVSSFHARSLRLLKQLEPALTTGWSYPFDRARISERRAFQPLIRVGLQALRQPLPARIGRRLARAGADAALVHHALVSPRLVERCHARGAAVLAWTIEDARTLEEVLATGVDGVIVNDPRLFDV
jgi:glycerophosphoryl diester phosphodiesterase